MNDIMCMVLQKACAALSVLLMAMCGVRLLARLWRVVRGEESFCGRDTKEEYGFASRQHMLMAMCAALLSRLLIYLLAYAMYRFEGGSGSFAGTLEPLWSHWDTRHYVGIAQEGYTAVGDERLRLVFFPLFPMMMRLLSPLTGGNVFLAGLLISLMSTAGSAALLYDLAHVHYGARTAAMATAFFLLSPMSVFLCCCYTEGLFIFLTLAAMALMRRGHPWCAAAVGFLCAFTRMPGVIVAGLMIIAAIGRCGQEGLRVRTVFACAGQVLIVFSGLFLYWGINYAVTGDPFMYMTYQLENWYQAVGSFWKSMENTVYYALSTVGDGDWMYTWGFQLLCMLYVFVLLAFRGGRLPFDLEAYSFVYVAVVLAPTWLLSGPRYLYALTPLHLLKARAHESRAMDALALAAHAVLLVVFVYGYTIAVEVL